MEEGTKRRAKETKQARPSTLLGGPVRQLKWKLLPSQASAERRVRLHRIAVLYHTVLCRIRKFGLNGGRLENGKWKMHRMHWLVLSTF